MRQTLLIPILFLASLAAPQGGSGQEMAWTFGKPAGGWIGITVDFALEAVGDREETVVLIKEVVEGSPAELAGMRVGDTITHLNRRPVSQELFSSLPETLEPGDVTLIRVNRGGGSQEFRIEAGERPSSYLIIGPDRERMVVQLETLSGNILKNLDSLRLNLAGLHLDNPTGDMRVQVLRVPAGGDEEGKVGFSFHFSDPFPDTLGFEAGNVMFAPEFALPFQAFIVESQATSELKDELARLGKEITSIRRAELARQRELSAAGQGSSGEILRRDEKIRDLQSREALLLDKQKELSARLRQVSEEEIQRQWSQARAMSEEAREDARRDQLKALEAFRRERANVGERERSIYDYSVDQYRSPVIMGQNVYWGAQLAPLNPDLAQYFFVDEGVFVVQVVEGTPASDAGLQGGDVIVRIGDREVTSLSDLRMGLAAHEGSLPVRVIRKGTPVEIVIRK